MTTERLYPDRPVLLVDDEPAWTHSLALSLKVSGGINHTLVCNDSREAQGLLEQHDCCLVLLDLTMPYLGGEDLLGLINESRPEVPVIIISGMNQIETAIRCVKAGAEDFFVKTDERERVVSGVVRILRQIQLRDENRRLKNTLLQEPVERPPAFSAFHTRSSRMQTVFAYLTAISRSREAVLITGESGTGKELIARSLHQLSCPDAPWVAVNVAGLDDDMFSDTLFGHVPGAYTGADRSRPGMVEEAGAGILFLDEIGDLSKVSQVKLLRLLQEGEYYPLGSDQPRSTRARIIAATNQDLAARETEGTFRRDLLYRLGAHQVEIPPLRERPEDLPLLLDAFLEEAAAQMACKKPRIPAELPVLLSTYGFPGNIRELRAMVFDAVSLHKGGVLSMQRFKELVDTQLETGTAGRDMPPVSREMVFPQQLPTLKEVSQQLVDEALRRAQGNQSLAARMLGVSPQALNKRLKSQS